MTLHKYIIRKLNTCKLYLVVVLGYKSPVSEIVADCWFRFPIVGLLKKICKDYYDRMYICEEQKWDLEREVRKRDFEVPNNN